MKFLNNFSIIVLLSTASYSIDVDKHLELSYVQTNGNTNLDELAEQCQKILNTEYSDKLDELYRLGGTSGGARPKIMTTIDEEE